MQSFHNKNLILDSFRDEWLDCRIKNSFVADCECAGLFLGMLKKNNSHSFVSRRLRTAHRLFMGKNLWRNSNLNNSWDIEFSLCNFKSQKIFIKFNIINKNFHKKIFIDDLIEISQKIFTKKFYWYWLRGLWGSSGNVYFPKNGYSLSLLIPNVVTRNIAINVLEKTKLSWFERHNEFNLRNHEDIVTFLNNIGLPSAALKLEEIAIFKSVRNQLNRSRNSETANIKRSVEASREQVKIAQKIIDNGLLDSLPQKLRDLVILRLEEPEASLSELGRNLSPQIKKSAVKYRWLSIMKFINNS